MKNILEKKNIKFYEKDKKIFKKAEKIIPGGTQLFSKKPELFAPGIWPGYYSKARGVHIWDLDNKKYLDMSIMNVGACILGYSDKDVDNAVKKEYLKRSVFLNKFCRGV